MPLSSLAVANAKQQHRPYILTDGNGLHLLITPSGSKPLASTPHKDGKGFNIMLQAFPLDGKIVCREISGDENPAPPARAERNDRQQRRSR
jgi:hypothetical protein